MEQKTIEQNAENDFLTINAKSSVKLKQTTKGLTWEIKVVTGEGLLINKLMQDAIAVHESLLKFEKGELK